MSTQHHQSPSPAELELLYGLIKDLGALYSSGEYSDVTLVVAGERINSHKVILAARSQYFRALLYGGLKESSQHEIELKGTTVPAIRGLLEFIYTGRISFANQHEEVIMDILQSAHQYGLKDVETAIADYLGGIIDIRNVCLIFDAARLYRIEFLSKLCREYVDKHALEVIRHETFLRLSLSSLNVLIARDSFYAPEIDVFLAVQSWLKANPDEAAENVVGQVRLELVGMKDLLRIVRPSGLISSEDILNAFDVQTETDDAQYRYRGRLVPEENVASTKLGAQVLQGEMPEFLLNGDTQNYNGDRGYTRHLITDSREYEILVKLGTRRIINHVKMLLWDLDSRSYSYYVEVSVNQKTWVRVVDHTEYFCRSWQYLYFDARVVTYIRIVGTNNTVNEAFHLVNLEASFTHQPVNLCNGFVIPTENVATTERSACIAKGVNRPDNALLNGDTSTYTSESGWTSHQIGPDSILVQLGQPYMIDSMRLLLWDRDERSYSYYIEVSVNLRDWIVVADKTKDACKSWQTIRFQPPRPVVFIRIKGTDNTVNDFFHCVHFECPAQTDDAKSIVAI